MAHTSASDDLWRTISSTPSKGARLDEMACSSNEGAPLRFAWEDFQSIRLWPHPHSVHPSQGVGVLRPPCINAHNLFYFDVLFLTISSFMASVAK